MLREEPSTQQRPSTEKHLGNHDNSTYSRRQGDFFGLRSLVISPLIVIRRLRHRYRARPTIETRELIINYPMSPGLPTTENDSTVSIFSSMVCFHLICCRCLRRIVWGSVSIASGKGKKKRADDPERMRYTARSWPVFLSLLNHV